VLGWCREDFTLYGLIVKLTAAPGRRSELIVFMGGADSHTIPGCLSFIIAEDAADEDSLWITEVWESQERHEESLRSQPIRESLTDADTLIVGFEKIATTLPVQGSSHPLHGED
jgi:quinol monooxygenase YgiN